MMRVSSATDGLLLDLEDDTEGGCVDAYIGTEHVGALCWSGVVISDLWVHAAYRRQGIATTMYRFALDHVDLVHSDDFTEAGSAWITSLNGNPNRGLL